MILPGDSIGISDILGWRECPRRMDFGMRRHTPAGEHPEAATPSTAYGSAAHDMLEFVGRNDAFDDEAVQYAFDRHARWLEPDDLKRLREDLATYRLRDYLGVRTIAVEGEYRTPIVTHKGTTYYFRFKVDRLYQSLSDPTVFIHIDYKTSRWPKSEEEVHSDPQLWSYNFGIHDVFPECATLVQVYDQLRYGAIPTRKSDAQREQIKEWLARHVVAILEDDARGADDLLLPKLNEWCAYCAIAESCSVIPQLTEYAKVKIAALAPERKEGRKVVTDLDPSRVEEYVSELDKVSQAKKLLERYESSVKALLQQMPQERRAALGYGVRERRVDYLPPEAMHLAHEVMGDAFYEAIGVSKTAIERLPDPVKRDFLLGLMEKRVGSTWVQKEAKKAA